VLGRSQKKILNKKIIYKQNAQEQQGAQENFPSYCSYTQTTAHRPLHALLQENDVS